MEFKKSIGCQYVFGFIEGLKEINPEVETTIKYRVEKSAIIPETIIKCNEKHYYVKPVDYSLGELYSITEEEYNDILKKMNGDMK